MRPQKPVQTYSPGIGCALVEKRRGSKVRQGLWRIRGKGGDSGRPGVREESPEQFPATRRNKIPGVDFHGVF